MRSRMVLMNPGPVVVDERVRQSVLRPDICHRESEFADLLRSVQRGLIQVCGGDVDYGAVIFSGSGTAATEATLSSIVPEDGKVLILDNGHYGERLLKICAAHAISTSRLSFGWAKPIDLAVVEQALAVDRTVTHVAMVHHETSTGMLNPVSSVGRLVAQSQREFVLDAISSLGGEALNVREDNVDWCIGTANKCIESFPGVSFVCAPLDRLGSLKAIAPRTFYLDLYAHHLAQALGTPPFTPAVQTLYALECALGLLISEGISGRAARYRDLAERLRSGMAKLGFSFLLAPEHRSNTITSFYLRPGQSYTELHDGLKAKNFVIYESQAGLRDITFRIANMGQITLDDVDRFLMSLERLMRQPSTYQPDMITELSL